MGFFKTLTCSLTLKIGALENQTTTMTMNIVQNYSFSMDGTGMIGIVTIITTGSAKSAKVRVHTQRQG